MRSMSTEWVIQPATIRQKAERRYRDFLIAWLQGKVSDIFPMEIAGRKKVSSKADIGELIKQMRKLRAESTEFHSRGYRVEWKQVDSPRFGKNEFPDNIFIDSLEDFLFLVEKRDEFGRLETVVTRIRDSFPELNNCLLTQLSILPKLANDIESLVTILKYFRENPKPDCFLREIPAKGIDTKFIERTEIASVLRQWLDTLLPSWAIRSDENHFARRYFLRYDEPLVRIRFLDPTLQCKLCFPCSDVAIPLHTFGALDISKARVIVVENKVSLLTLPALTNALAIGGMGYSVTLLKYATWLQASDIIYWGDLDSDGFRILSNLRAVYPHTTSILMNAKTLKDLSSLVTDGNGRQIETPPLLTEEEMDAFLWCRDDNIRLEQERIPIAYFFEAI